MRTPATTLTTCIAVVVLACACVAPIDVQRASVRDVYAELDAHTLNADRLSDDTRVALDRAGLSEHYADEPTDALAQLHRLAEAGDSRSRLFALAECSFETAEATGDRDLYVAAATYAYLFLFDGEEGAGPFRRRFRRACDLYGASLALAFSDDEGRFQPRGGSVALPVGSLEIETPQLPLRFGGFEYGDMTPAITLEVDGFRARSVRSGVGAPLVAVRRPGRMSAERRSHLAPRSALAVTAVLRIDGHLAGAEAGALRASFSFHQPDGEREFAIGDRQIPVEFDVTAPLAWELADARSWESELGSVLDSDAAGVRNALYLTEPYRPGRVPILFVHGTASSPARWAEILNELHDDGRISGNCQFWIYQYGSGAPILASAASLRASLLRVVHDLDPDGADPALQEMVVVGHSQGGLLTRLLVTDSGTRFWDMVSDVPLDEAGLRDSERRYAEKVFFFEPVRNVRRTIFVATPHRGSHIAGSWIGRLGAGLISIPRTVLRGAGRLAKRVAGFGGDDLAAFSTAVDDMSPGSPFLETLAAGERARDVTWHSIVAVDGDGPVEEGDDGVVEYTSAHVDAASEVIVPSFHSCQEHPATVAEIRRILHEHLDALGR